MLVTVVVVAGLVAGCQSSKEKQIEAATSSLQAAKVKCDATPFRTSVERARCANTAEETFLVPVFPDSDLVRLKMAARMSLAEKVDARQISQADADLEMARVTSQGVAETERRFNQRRSIAAQENLAASVRRATTSPSLCAGGPNVVGCI
ncbi:hypothetical protein [Methylobacterium aquaticum]|uniref:Uncharacterized protein n=1 Tax=Methylobacterium aquaticum TaxID=270351 RepID=A0A0C6FMY5_9HYPH|nr:hypothetical protein [Methylobacterium aquaticum]BAQ43965.1 hypothetical protein Maq22A_c02425 [Methylobacterium aquaticum]